MKPKRLAFEYVSSKEQPFITYAMKNGKVVADYIFLTTPAIINGHTYWFIINFYPTKDTMFITEGWMCIEAIESQYQLWRANELNM